jgi:uncharacterized protein
MIKTREIQQKAQQDGVRDTQIEKDYILSWILWGVARHQALAQCLVFKGGTALKKIYFNDYRFSEDLDFTLIDQELSNDQLLAWFDDSFSTVREAANIPLSLQLHQEHQDGGLNFYIQYVGPLGGLGANKTVKVDISRNEQLVFAPGAKQVITNYSDLEQHELLCYSLEEVLVEKLRSVMQRMQARDFYDIWYLMEVQGLQPDFHYREFCRKCLHKGVKPTDFPQKLADRLPQYKARWKNSINDQIRYLPDFDKVVREVQKHLRKMPFDR